MQLHERTIPTDPHAHETRLLCSLRVQRPHVETHRRPRGRGKLAPRLKRIGGRVQHHQVAALIEHDLSQLTVVEAPRERRPRFGASPDARSRHETASVATLPGPIQPLPPTIPKSRIALSHALLTLGRALSGGNRPALLLARLIHGLDDHLDDRRRNEHDDQNVVGVISDSLHLSTPPRSTKSPEFIGTRGICSCDWIRTSNRPINSRMLCR